MLKTYLTSSWRNLKKNKLVSTINILGLTIGLTTAILAIIYAQHELSFENVHEKADRISMVYSLGDFGSIKKISQSWGAVSTRLTENYPEIEMTALTRNVDAISFMDSIPTREDNIMIAEPGIFEMFSFNFIQGTIPQDLLQIAISSKTAARFFDQENPLSQLLTLKVQGHKIDFEVVGVYKSLPQNTHLQADFILSMDLAQRFNWKLDSYESSDYVIYALTRPGTDFKALNSKIASTLEIPVPIENLKAALVPIKRIHLKENIIQNNQANLYLLLVGGILTLIISCFNYINLNTILFSTRTKEVGIKKSFGANKRMIFSQFITDTLLVAVIGMSVAVVLLHLILPHFNALLSSGLAIVLDFELILTIFIILVITLIAAGVYPAWSSTFHQPIVLMSKVENKISGKKRFMNTLITLQFIVAVILFQFVYLSEKQGRYMISEDVSGFDGSDVVCINGWEWGDLSVVKHELKQSPAIQSVSWSHALPSMDMSLTTTWKSEENKETALRLFQEDGYLDVFKIDMEAGRFFSDKYPHDQENCVVINPLTAQSLGFADPVGQKVMIDHKPYEIIGVVDNYQAVPPIFEDMPMLIMKPNQRANHLLVRIDPGQRKEAHHHIQQTLHKINPEAPIEINYYDDLVYESSRTYIASFTILNIFTGIIIFNSMMGLFGLSFFVAERKNKEVGVRKVCGASVTHLFWNLGKGFIYKLILAFSIASPLVYLAGQGYLNTFPRHINLSADIFLAGGLMSLLMLVLATGWKIYQVSTINPSQILRHE